MDALYLWPDQPALSLFILWLASIVFLWAAREPMMSLIKSFWGLLVDGFRGISRWTDSTAKELEKRRRATLFAAGELECQGTLDREFQRIDNTYAEQLGQYAKLHRRLDDLMMELESDYKKCGEAPPEVPGWTAAVEAVAQIPVPGDPNVQKVFESIRKSSKEAEKKALQAYREDTAQRHKLLGSMAPWWKEVRGLMTRMKDSVATALESTTRIHGYMEGYETLRSDQAAAARVLTYSATKLFMISLIVLAVALGGAFINFQLIALPMSELVPAGARLGGIPVSTVSALVIVLMETVLGIFIMDMLGITDLFPKLQSVPASRRKMILALALGGLFFLAAVESSLAVLREQIVAAEQALKISLAGEESRLVTQASSSMIPVVGQAVLGFVLPWVLAMVAIPLEMLIDSSRHVLASILVLFLHGVGHLTRMLAHTASSLAKMSVNAYDIYIAIPLRIERSVRGKPQSETGRSTARGDREEEHPSEVPV
jgi:hypothetical protein